ncbi:MAG: flagellar basal body P-ring protein FlgI [Acidobacteriota bacterium]|nr:flagellar basal body P-ring protein FlgI [Acidobacteriota bacterium]
MKRARNLLLSFLFVLPVFGLSKLKDLATVEGVRDNQLLGYGLVVGLAGTGDRQQTVFSAQSLANVLQRMGVTVSPTAITVKNTAAVLVTGTLPPFAQPGMKIDVTVSSIGDAPNLQGGLLIMTPLRAADGLVYAVAQGALLTGGFSAGGAGTVKVVNHPTVGRIPEGALVEKLAPSSEPKSEVKLQLKRMDFGTASLVAEAINKKYSNLLLPPARAENGSVVTVTVPHTYSNRSVEFIAELEDIAVEPQHMSRIVVNERTGTIVMGKDVHVAAVAIMHGNLTVEVQTTYSVSQPAPFSQGSTEVVPETQVTAKEDKAKNLILKDGATVEDLVRGLNTIGSTPRDIIAILQDLRAAGALDADLEVI